jgi:hypothetical protein
MLAEFVKGIAEPVLTYAVREGPSPPLHRLRKQETDDGRRGSAAGTLQIATGKEKIDNYNNAYEA